jgi:hypothetical protein
MPRGVLCHTDDLHPIYPLHLCIPIAGDTGLWTQKHPHSRSQTMLSLAMQRTEGQSSSVRVNFVDLPCLTLYILSLLNTGGHGNKTKEGGVKIHLFFCSRISMCRNSDGSWL